MNELKRATLTIDETAARLGISRALAYRLAAQGELPGVRKLGRRLVVSRVVLEQYLASRQAIETAVLA